jgi:hypothetical protein
MENARLFLYVWLLLPGACCSPGSPWSLLLPGACCLGPAANKRQAGKARKQDLTIHWQNKTAKTMSSKGFFRALPSKLKFVIFNRFASS